MHLFAKVTTFRCCVLYMLGKEPAFMMLCNEFNSDNILNIEEHQTDERLAHNKHILQTQHSKYVATSSCDLAFRSLWIQLQLWQHPLLDTHTYKWLLPFFFSPGHVNIPKSSWPPAYTWPLRDITEVFRCRLSLTTLNPSVSPAHDLLQPQEWINTRHIQDVYALVRRRQITSSLGTIFDASHRSSILMVRRIRVTEVLILL